MYCILHKWSVTLLSLAILCILSSQLCKAQSAKEYCVQLTATVQENPPVITLHWPFDTTGVTNYLVRRKPKSATSWVDMLGTLPATATSYSDSTVTGDTALEYTVYKNATAPGAAGAGYIFAGIKSPAIEYRGKLLMIVDSALNDSVSSELYRLMTDISGDGWAVDRIDVNDTNSDVEIKNLILNEYAADSVNLKAVLLIGHIAVPYSGELNPDGHPQHLGAWPADIYYGCMHLPFTDIYIDDTMPGVPTVNQNIPGDGKWDQTSIGGNNMQLQVSRIDLSNMSAFNSTENLRMKNYLDKDHAYRMKILTTIPRGLIDDNFHAFSGEAFSVDGWENFAPLLGDTNIFELDYISTLDTANYLWAYGCGPGSYTSAGGIGSSTDFVNTRAQSIFTMMFGSFFGDWNNDNNFLRAPLCAPEPALTNCWAGRPRWLFHHMAMGENIGYSANLTQNQQGFLYNMDYGANYVHVALMGDLTLREHTISPPSITALSDTDENVNLLWTSSPDSVLGYYVYRCNTQFGIYKRVTPNIVTGNTFTDIGAGGGLKYYMVKAIRLENTPSGTYYNLSEGIADTITVRDTVDLASSISEPDLQAIKFSLYPNPANDVLNAEVDLTGRDNYILTIIDATGCVVSSLVYGNGTRFISLPVNTLPSGVYFCRMSCAEGTLQKRFEIIR